MSAKILIVAEHDGARLNVSTAKCVSCARALAGAEIAVAVAINVIGVVMTSSPGPTPSASSEMCSPPVQLVSPRAWRTPR